MKKAQQSIIWKLSFCTLRPIVRRDWEQVHSRIVLEQDKLARYPKTSPTFLMQKLLVSGEDHRHSHHPGFDLIAIGRAIWRRLTLVSREGASTIEQQLVRTITGKYKRTIGRKATEIILAILVDATFEKSTLPAVYLSIAYYGWRMNGYLQACHRLELQPDSLTTNEAAGLVSRLKYPEPRAAPVVRILQIERRRKHLLKLYEKHVQTATYEYLDDKTVLSQRKPIGSVQSISDVGPSFGRFRGRHSSGTGDVRTIMAK